MDGVVKDLKKIGTQSAQISKKLIYYGYIPLILYLGFKTVDWENLIPKQ